MNALLEFFPGGRAAGMYGRRTTLRLSALQDPAAVFRPPSSDSPSFRRKPESSSISSGATRRANRAPGKEPAGPRRIAGFSLLELSLIILILGLLTPLAWRFIAAQGEQKITRVSYSLLERADQALTGYAMAHDRLPCPDSGSDGEENCTASIGRLPYKTLGMADARAGQIRYGVLRRTATVDDPEAHVADPAPALPRGADLTATASDRFYPLFAYVKGGTGSALSYLQSVPELKTDPDDADPSKTTGGAYMVASANIEIDNANSLDFCYTLRVAEDPPPTSDTEYLRVDGRQMAYALALPGSNNLPADFVAPSAPQTWEYDGRSRAVSPALLWQRLECAGTLAAAGHAHPNAASATAMLYRAVFDVEQVLQQTVELEDVNVMLATAGVIAAVASVVDVVGASLHAAGDTAKTFGVNVWSVVSAVVAGVAAALDLTLASIGLDSAFESRDMAEQRYAYVQHLRASLRTLARGIALNALAADAHGSYGP